MCMKCTTLEIPNESRCTGYRVEESTLASQRRIGVEIYLVTQIHRVLGIVWFPFFTNPVEMLNSTIKLEIYPMPFRLSRELFVVPFVLCLFSRLKSAFLRVNDCIAMLGVFHL